jgi:hypothetical protein
VTAHFRLSLQLNWQQLRHCSSHPFRRTICVKLLSVGTYCDDTNHMLFKCCTKKRNCLPNNKFTSVTGSHILLGKHEPHHTHHIVSMSLKTFGIDDGQGYVEGSQQQLFSSLASMATRPILNAAKIVPQISSESDYLLGFPSSLWPSLCYPYESMTGGPYHRDRTIQLDRSSLAYSE